MTLVASGFSIVLITAVLLHNWIVDRRVRRQMRAYHGATGRTRAWTGADGRRYCYDLTAGKIVRA